MKTMMLADFLALAKSLPKNVALWALLATGICLAAGNATPIILLTGFPMSHMVLMPMLLRDQRRDWVAFRQALPLSRANVVAGRYASIAVVVAGCVALGVAAYTFALTIAMFSVLLPFMFADSHRKLASYIPFAYMLALMGWIYIFRSMNFDAFLPLVGRIVVAAQSLGGALVVGGCVTAAALALYVVSERAAVRGYATRDL